jgi:putative SOS response-associated peptidase YedK
MCNQFQLASKTAITDYLKKELKLPLVDNKMPADLFAGSAFPKSWVPVLLYQDKKLQLVAKKWGYPNPYGGQPLFNARVERFYEAKPSLWDASFARRRCLILTPQFYESGTASYQTNNGKRYKERFAFAEPQVPLTLLAGIYEDDHFALVTTKPNQAMAPVHDRMPMVIRGQELRHYLFQNFTDLCDRSSLALSRQKLPHKN